MADSSEDESSDSSDNLSVVSDEDFVVSSSSEASVREATLCKARAERAAEGKFSATDCGILSEVFNAYDMNVPSCPTKRTGKLHFQLPG